MAAFILGPAPPNESSAMAAAMRVARRSKRQTSLLDNAVRLKGTPDVAHLVWPVAMRISKLTARRLVITFVSTRTPNAPRWLAFAGIELRRCLLDPVYFAGYGLAWLGAARRSPIRAGEVRLLAGVMLVSAVGRVISLVHNGRPHWFQEVLTAVEFIVPAAFFGIANADEAQTIQKGRLAG